MTNKLLTISIAAYNAEQYIAEAVDSIVNARKRDLLEIFIIDDGGSDSTLKMAQNYEKEFPGIIHAIHKENGGWGSTVNYSIEHASGKYFRILDADDYFDTQGLNQFIDYIDKTDSDLIVSGIMEFEDVTRKQLCIKSVSEVYTENREYRYSELTIPFYLSMHSFTVKTSLLQKNRVRCGEKCLYRDFEFVCKSIAITDTILFFRSVVYCYRLGRAEQSVSRSSFLRHRTEHESMVFEVLKTANNIYEPEKRTQAFYLASAAVSQQYRIFCSVPPHLSLYRDYKRFNERIKKEYPLFREQYTPTKKVRLIKNLGFVGYHIICCCNLFTKR